MGHTLRTPRLHAALAHNYNNIKEKGLLLLEQPSVHFPLSEGCTAYGTLFEHLPEFAIGLQELNHE